MIVVDASVAVEIVLQTARGRALTRRLLVDEAPELHGPHLIGVEVLQALRRLARSGAVTPTRADEAVVDFFALPIERHSHELLLPRAWELRDNLTLYDAVYVALAELLRAPLLTGDTRLAKCPGITARVEVV